MSLLEILSTVSSIATTIGGTVAAYQLFVTRRQATTTFEDTLNIQYRQSIKKLPIEALFGKPLNAQELSSLTPHFYRYCDLCNEQAFIFSLGRVSKKPGRTGKMELRATWIAQLSKLRGMRLLVALVATSNRLEPYALY